jgi:hypothetical protein
MSLLTRGVPLLSFPTALLLPSVRISQGSARRSSAKKEDEKRISDKDFNLFLAKSPEQEKRESSKVSAHLARFVPTSVVWWHARAPAANASLPHRLCGGMRVHQQQMLPSQPLPLQNVFYARVGADVHRALPFTTRRGNLRASRKSMLSRRGRWPRKCLLRTRGRLPRHAREQKRRREKSRKQSESKQRRRFEQSYASRSKVRRPQPRRFPRAFIARNHSLG